MEAHEISILELCGGGSALSDAERQQAAQINAIALRLDREQWLKEDAAALGVLRRKLPQDALYLSSFREYCRADYELGHTSHPALQPAYELEAAIVRRHDPTVVYDPRTKALVTQNMLRGLKTRATWLAQQQNLPGPDDSFVEVARRELVARFRSMTPKEQEAFSHIESNSLYLAAGLNAIPPAKRRSVAQAQRDSFHSLSAATIQWQLALGVATASQSARTALSSAQGSAAGLAALLSMQGITNRALQQGAWQAGNPGCGIGGDAAGTSACAGAPITRPLPVPMIVPQH